MAATVGEGQRHLESTRLRTLAHRPNPMASPGSREPNHLDHRLLVPRNKNKSLPLGEKQAWRERTPLKQRRTEKT